MWFLRYLRELLQSGFTQWRIHQAIVGVIVVVGGFLFKDWFSAHQSVIPAYLVGWLAFYTFVVAPAFLWHQLDEKLRHELIKRNELEASKLQFEKSWERKAEAYQRILEALHHLKNHAEHELKSYEINNPFQRPKVEKVLEELDTKMVCATAEIRKWVDIGASVISEEAVSALCTLQIELDQSTIPNDFREHLNLKLSAINKCLDSMLHITKNDRSLP